MNKTLYACALVIGLGGLAMSGCAVTSGQSSVGEYIDDKTIATRVKANFAKDETVSAMRIEVGSVNGMVQLSGFATSAAEKARAAEIARGTPEVKGVRNDIIVRAAN
ncbi:MAG: BON domain-containing protein [Methylibium sp.]|uniref:BON domain-containing protein n=1 Tax=Methylibium sp. TaxID=2067992 RepID=UPI00179A7639|nr:BON domain-containing protein [Methylibium sp.]MBA3596913.1 BON domain-containing protein [Methylibium sp.]